MTKPSWRRLRGGGLLAPHHQNHQQAAAEKLRALDHAERLASAPVLSPEAERELIERHIAAGKVKVCDPGDRPPDEPAFDRRRPPVRLG